MKKVPLPTGLPSTSPPFQSATLSALRAGFSGNTVFSATFHTRQLFVLSYFIFLLPNSKFSHKSV